MAQLQIYKHISRMAANFEHVVNNYSSVGVINSLVVLIVDWGL